MEVELVLNKFKIDASLDMGYVINEGLNADTKSNFGMLVHYMEVEEACAKQIQGRDLGWKINSSVERFGRRVSHMPRTFELMGVCESSRERMEHSENRRRMGILIVLNCSLVF